MTDEMAHAGGSHQLWGESWYFDFADLDATFGGYIRLGTYPNMNVAWLWLILVGDDLPGLPVISVVRHDLALPAGVALAVGGNDCSVSLNCERPYELWSVRAEAVACGGALPVRLDLMWRAEASAYWYSGSTRYEQACRVTGKVRVAGQVRSVDAPGQRDHSWGIRDWWRARWLWAAAALTGGVRFQATQLLLRRRTAPDGYVVGPGDRQPEPLRELELAGLPGTDGSAEGSTRISAAGLEMTATPRHVAPVSLMAPDGSTGTLLRTLSSFADSGGRCGSGWVEWNLPDVARGRPGNV